MKIVLKFVVMVVMTMAVLTSRALAWWAPVCHKLDWECSLPAKVNPMGGSLQP
jgi:hypothetical protein